MASVGDPAAYMSSQTDGIEPTQDAPARRPNQLSLNVLNEAVPRVSDITGEAVQREFVLFLES